MKVVKCMGVKNVKKEGEMLECKINLNEIYKKL